MRSLFTRVVDSTPRAPWYVFSRFMVGMYHHTVDVVVRTSRPLQITGTEMLRKIKKFRRLSSTMRGARERTDFVIDQRRMLNYVWLESQGHRLFCKSFMTMRSCSMIWSTVKSISRSPCPWQAGSDVVEARRLRPEYGCCFAMLFSILFVDLERKSMHLTKWMLAEQLKKFDRTHVLITQTFSFFNFHFGASIYWEWDFFFS